MSTAAALVTWGRAAASADDFRAWHNREHLPERAGIAGFRRCRRFRSIADDEFLTFYEVASAGVFASPAYRALLDAPSASTRRILAGAATGAARMIGGISYCAERGLGGTVAVWRFDDLPPDAAAQLAALRVSVLPALAAHPALAALRLVEQLTTANETGVAALAALPAIVVPRAVIIAEGWGSDDDLAEACAAMTRALPFAAPPPCRRYRLEVMMGNTPC